MLTLMFLLISGLAIVVSINENKRDKESLEIKNRLDCLENFARENYRKGECQCQKK